MERRLAAILAADVVGYSRLVEADEEATLGRLSTYREFIDKVFAEHQGRVFGSAGDSVIAEFVSPVEAVRCAISIQREIEQRNAELPADRRMQFRIGINLGDVVVEGDNLLGDGVNVAARLEELADAGGICLSEGVYAQVKKTLGLGYEFLGKHKLKNIEEPVPVYRVHVDPGAVPKISGAKRRQWQRAAIATVVIVVVAVVSVVAWDLYLRPASPPAEVASGETPVLELPDKPSIAVLAFDNLSGDPKQEYLSDGISEAIITGLSRFPELFVIARKSSFSYKGSDVRVQQMAEELGVHFILEGSVQRSDDRIRVTAQLIDATTSRHLWAERYDRQWKDVFALQDDITQHIVAKIVSFEGPLEEASRGWARQKAPADLRAYDYLLLGRAQFFLVTKDENAKARESFRKSVELDPNYSLGHTWLAWTHIVDNGFGWGDDSALSLNLALDHAQKAVELDNAEASAHWVLGSGALLRRTAQGGVARVVTH